MLKSMREQIQDKPKQVPIFDSSNKTIGNLKNSSGFTLINSAYANPFATTTITTGYLSELPWLEAASLSGVRNLTPYLFSTAVNVAKHVPSATFGAGIVVGLHNAAKFESEHPLFSEEFNDIITDPYNLIPQSVKDSYWQKATNDPLLGSNNQRLTLPHINVNDYRSSILLHLIIEVCFQVACLIQGSISQVY